MSKTEAILNRSSEIDATINKYNGQLDFAMTGKQYQTLQYLQKIYKIKIDFTKCRTQRQASAKIIEINKAVLAGIVKLRESV